MGFNLPIDSYDKLYIRNENIAAPTTFEDSSTANTKTITANGNAKQLPIKFNKSAGFFNGTTDYVVVPDSSDWDVGTGNFTIEAFVFLTTVTGNQAVWARNSSTELMLQINSGVPVFYSDANLRITSSQTLVANTWYHLMVVRTGTGAGQTTLYVDGANGVTGTVAYNVTSSSALTIGAANAGVNYFSGWIKEVRFSDTNRSVAVPTTAYTSDSNTKLLLHFDTPATSPIAPAIYFDGTGDYLSVADHADWDFGTGDFCLEGYFCPDGNLGATSTLAEIGNAGTVGARITYNGGGAFLGIINGSAIVTATITPVTNAWYHAALVRSGGTLYVYINGRLINSAANSTDITGSTAGARVGSDQSNQAFKGWAREVQVSNVARYTAAFTPSQTGFTVDSNTKLYIKGNEANGVTTFVDSETTPKTVTTNGNTVIKYTEDYRSCIFKDDGNTGHKPYPVSTAKVDFFAMSTGVGLFPSGASDNITVPDSADWDFGTSAYTVELHIRFNAFSADNHMFSVNAFNPGAGPSMHIASTTLYYGGSTDSHTATWAPVVNTWYHVALCRESTAANKFRVFINGTLLQQDTSSANITGSTYGVVLGYDPSVGATNGRIDNFRIANGVARYTATFDPPYDPIFNGGGNFFLVF